jgi:hypothetical protein
MTRKQFRKSVSDTVKAVFKKTGLYYNQIEIKFSLPYLSVGDVLFAQGEDAQFFIDNAQALSDNTGLNIKTSLVFLLDSAGIFQKNLN